MSKAIVAADPVPAAIAKADSELVASPDYQIVLEACKQVQDECRTAFLRSMWLLGEIISEACSTRDDAYGDRIIHQLEQDLIIDRTTLTRSRQLYETFTLEEIGDGSSPRLTWSKMKMLLPLPADWRELILSRIRSGDLRTDDDVRTAIWDLKRRAGQLPDAALADAQMTLFDVEGLKRAHVEALQRLWRRATPADRTKVTIGLISEIGLQALPRPDALAAISDLEASVKRLRRTLDGKGDQS